MKDIIKKMLDIMSSRDKKKLIFLIIIHFFSSISGIIGIATVIPFIAIISNPNFITTNRYINFLFVKSGFTLYNFVIATGVLMLLVFILSNFFIALSTWYNIRFARRMGLNLSKNLFNKYISSHYEFFLQRNASEFLKNVVSEVNTVVNNTIKTFVDLIAKSLLIIFIFAGLIYINPMAAIFMVVFLGSIYFIIYTIIKKRLVNSSKELVVWNRVRHKLLYEAFGGIKDVKLFGKEPYFYKKFLDSSYIIEEKQSSVQILGQMPKYFLESIAFGGILAIALILFIINKSSADIFPLLGLYAFAGYRIMPSLEAIFRSVSTMRGAGASLDIIHKEFTTDTVKLIAHLKDKQSLNPVIFKNNITLKDITFQYANKDKPIFNKLNLVINSNQTIAFVGTTGCGKTTIVDIMLGLLKPMSGEILIDDKLITEENIRSWQRHIGYVSQQIYLSDDSVTNNIAFGVEQDKIDHEAVQKAASIASIHNFVMEELSDGYNTRVGDKGIRLSGGQRQRIGIARALYYNPDVLVFDEATSALDNLTEAAVMEAIDKLMGTKTIIIIAHRLSTVKKCDRIFLIDKGEIVDSGNYDELLNKSEQFREFASKS